MRTPEDSHTDPDQLIRLGTVASVDLAAARCVVTIDGQAKSPPLRWIEPRMGATRTWSPPSVGEQVVLLCAAGEIGGGVVLRGIPSDAMPPAGNSLTELVKFSDGTQLAYDPAGHALTVVVAAGGTMAITAPGGLTVTGPVMVHGDLTATGTITGQTDVIAATISGKGHKHLGVTAGTAVSGAPQ